MFKKIKEWNFGLIPTIFAVIGIILLAAALSFVGFALGYWLITLILATFFEFTLPFTWGYAFGGWLICIILYIFIAPGIFVSGNRRD